MKNITLRWLRSKSACTDGVAWFEKHFPKGGDKFKVLKALMVNKNMEKLNYANWALTRLFNKKQNVMYAIFAARQVLHLYEEKYPNDLRPRKAIEAAEAYLKHPCKKTKTAAWSAARSAWSAYSAAYSADSAARSAADSAAWSADSAARSAARSADSAAWSADSAAWSAYLAADSAAWSADSAMMIKILKYGIKLLKESEK